MGLTQAFADYSVVSQGVEAHNTNSAFTQATVLQEFYGANFPTSSFNGISVQNDQFLVGFTTGLNYLWSQSFVQVEIPYGDQGRSIPCTTQSGSYNCHMPNEITLTPLENWWTTQQSDGSCPSTSWTPFPRGAGNTGDCYIQDPTNPSATLVQIPTSDNRFDIYAYQQTNTDGTIYASQQYRLCSSSSCDPYTPLHNYTTPVYGQTGSGNFFFGTGTAHGTSYYGVQSLVGECQTCNDGHGKVTFQSGTYSTQTYTINSAVTGPQYRPPGIPNYPAEQNADLCWWNSITNSGGSNPTFTTSAVYSGSQPCSAGSLDPEININSYDTSGGTLTGLAAYVYDSTNTLVASGYTPLTVGVANGGTYTVKIDSYGSDQCTSAGDYPAVTSYTVASWGCQATVSVPSTGSINVNGYYGTNSGSSNNLQVSSADLNDNSLTGFYIQLDNSGGTQIGTGYTTVTFTGLSGSGTTYKVYANSWCNSSTHTDYTPSRWGDRTTGNEDTISMNYNTNIKVYYSTSSC
jgi:hypothetical protein